MSPDPKPAKRIVNRDAQPLESSPIRVGRCPLCHHTLVTFSRHHVVPKGQGGDDVPENLVWVCGDGAKGCHGVLTHHGRDGVTGLAWEDVASALVEYIDRMCPLTRVYAEQKRWPGFLEDYYLMGEAA